MKKSIILSSLLVLTACSGTTHHNSKLDVDLVPENVKVSPIEAKIEVGDKIAGSARCKDFMFFKIARPNYKTFGNNNVVNNKIGILADNDCTAGAMYDALSRTMDADVLVAPQYTTVQDNVLCIGSRCLYRDTKVTVTGWAGKVSYKK